MKSEQESVFGIRLFFVRFTSHFSFLPFLVSFFVSQAQLPSCFSAQRNSIINFDHLEKLSEIISFQGDSVGIVHIYSEYPCYNWVDANEEGIACVDDIARAAVLRLRHYELSKDLNSLKWARLYLKFILKMQAEDGGFHNFIDKSYEINRVGKTSFKSFGWWAVRGYLALAEGFRIFVEIDPQFADQLKNSFLKCETQIQNLLQKYPTAEEINGRTYPAWLVNCHAADATSVLIQSIVAYLMAQPDAELENRARLFGEGIMQMQLESEDNFPGAFLSFPDLWHAWGSSQTIGLSKLGRFLNEKEFLESAEKEIQQFYPILILEDGKSEIHISANKQAQFPQIAYGIRCISLGALEYYKATGDTSAAQLAGLLASWFLGNNPAQKEMYDPETGRGFDGIISPTEINKNAGAESTIEALMALLEVENNPISRPFLFAKQVSATENLRLGKLGEWLCRIYHLEDGSKYYLLFSTQKRYFKILAQDDWLNYGIKN